MGSSNRKVRPARLQARVPGADDCSRTPLTVKGTTSGESAFAEAMRVMAREPPNVAPRRKPKTHLGVEEEVGAVFGCLEALEGGPCGAGKTKRDAVPGEGQLAQIPGLEERKEGVAARDPRIAHVSGEPAREQSDNEQKKHDPAVDGGQERGSCRRFLHCARILSRGLERFNEARYDMRVP